MSHHVLYWYCVGFWALFVSGWMASSYIFLNFALSHTYLPVTTEPTHWVEYALVHTADVEQTRWCDYWMGFLNYQIEHHLFPQMPQFRQPLIMDRVRALAKKHNLPYTCYSYAEAIRQTYLNLHKVSEELIHAEWVFVEKLIELCGRLIRAPTNKETKKINRACPYQNTSNSISDNLRFALTVFLVCLSVWLFIITSFVCVVCTLNVTLPIRAEHLPIWRL